MINIVVGTSGHVDHGKTWLIKALTGKNTDRLMEEQKRGITIENGFSDMQYGDYNISFIDVPGHEKFIHNMLAGIGGIDIVLLVIDIEEGVMPQTVEHLEIVKMLGIEKGIVVLTKNDSSQDEEWKKLVEDDIRSMLENSTLENAPFIRVSSKTGENIEQLRTLIVKEAQKLNLSVEKDLDYRLPIDRVFTISGFGTVVTGTSLEGSLKVGDEVTIYPSGKRFKVRNLEVHGNSVKEAYARQRTAINILGAKKDDLSRGEVVAKGSGLKVTQMLNVHLRVFDTAERSIENGSRVHFFSGSTEAICKVVILDNEILSKGQDGYAQLRFEVPIAFKQGDKFIVRFYSPMETIGGGEILDANPVKAKRFDPKVISNLDKLSSGNIIEIVEAEIEKNTKGFMSIDQLASKLVLNKDEVDIITRELVEQGKITIVNSNKLVHRNFSDKVLNIAKKILGQYHSANPFTQGIKKEELKSRIAKAIWLKDSSDMDIVMQMIKDSQDITISSDLAALNDFKIEMTEDALKMITRIKEIYIKSGFDMPDTNDVIATEKDRKTALDMVMILAGKGEITKVNNNYFMDTYTYNCTLEKLKTQISKDGDITLATFRDLLGTSRKYAVAFLEHLDAIGITRKIDDVRVLS